MSELTDSLRREAAVGMRRVEGRCLDSREIDSQVGASTAVILLAISYDLARLVELLEK